MKRPHVLFSGAWRSEKGLSAMLVFLVLALFVGAPLVAVGKVGPVVFELFFTFLLLAGVLTVSRRQTLTVVTTVLVLLTLIVRWSGGDTPMFWTATLSIVSLSVLVMVIMVEVFSDGPVTSYRIQGAVVVYLLIGLIWTEGYELIHLMVPNAFRYEGAESLHPTHGLAYFSFVTLTTVGYGDITPLHPIARSMAMAEALIGQLYPAILLGRLVSLQIASKGSGERK